MENTFEWEGYHWMVGHKWGNTHPNCPNAWYDPESIIKHNEELSLIIWVSPRNINKSNPRYVLEDEPFDSSKPYKKYGVGLIRSLEEFKWGTFEIECTLPKGSNLWPAFWFGFEGSWPPEIDVFEGYTDARGSYSKNLFMNRLETNVHYNRSGTHMQIGPKTTLKCLKKKGINKYTLVWKPTEISIYYNGHRVRKVTDYNILEQMNKLTIHPIINIMVNQQFSEKDYNKFPKFIIHSFKYTPYEGR